MTKKSDRRKHFFFFLKKASFFSQPNAWHFSMFSLSSDFSTHFIHLFPLVASCLNLLLFRSFLVYQHIKNNFFYLILTLMINFPNTLKFIYLFKAIHKYISF